MADECEISHIGAHGDGVVVEGRQTNPEELDDAGEFYVPYTLAGEQVMADREGSFGRLTKILTPSAMRVAPECRHFTRCGGCKLQHMQFDEYLNWKAMRVGAAFAKRGLDCQVEPIWSAGLGARRRAVFAASRSKKSVIFGFHQYRNSVIENIDQCPVLVPAIQDQLSVLKDLAFYFMTRKSQIKMGVTACRDGLDVWIEGGRPELNADIVERVSPLCGRAHVQRLVVDGEILFKSFDPEVVLTGVSVPLHSGAFLQACGNAEARIVDIICEKLAKVKSIADLFSGVGTFSFALARHAQVLAVENSAHALDALRRGHDRATGLKPITTLNRDLMLDPMSAKELAKIDAVVFDPPRAGALAQAQKLATSDVTHVIAVSCNPNSLARDVRVLVDGGYEIKSVYPIDQFVYSPHVEVLVHLER